MLCETFLNSLYMEEWIEKYIALLLQNFKQEAFELKLKHVPSFFYKYRNLNEYTFNCLKLGTVWMPPASYLNDPFESSLILNDKELTLKFFRKADFTEEFFTHYNCEISKKEVEEILIDSDPEMRFQTICKQKNINEDFRFTKEIRKELLKEFVDKTKRQIRLCSFSERNDSILMWSHYSDGHKGICVQYDFQNDNDIYNYLEPVYYTNNIFDITPYFGSGRVPLKIAAIIKAKDWQYEKEWRLTFPTFDENPNNGYYSVSKPVAIFLGARFDDNSESNKKTLFAIAKEKDIPIYKMDIHSSEFKIVEIKKIEY